MIITDGLLLFILTYRIVDVLFKTIDAVAEKIALVFLLALGIKTFTLFFLLLFHLPVNPYRQILIDVILLVIALTCFKKKRKKSINNCTIDINMEHQGSKVFTALIFATLILTGISIYFSIYFPVTETDGVIYNLLGKMYFYETTLNPPMLDIIFTQYPPFVPLLTSYLLSYDIHSYKLFFPFFYISLIVIFYYQLKKFTNSSIIAAIFALVLSTTPYIWWHSYLMFLNLAAGFYFAAATLYWLLFTKYVLNYQRHDINVLKSYALLAGILYGLALWVRLEFLIYYFIPLFITIFITKELPSKLKKSFFLLLTTPVIIISSIWNLYTIIHFKDYTGFNYEILFINILLLAVYLLYAADLLKINKKLIPFYLTALCFVLLAVFYKYDLSASIITKKLETSIARTIVHNYFFTATSLLFLILFFIKFSSLEKTTIYCGNFLLLYLSFHTLIYCFGQPKWQSGMDYFRVTLFQPGLFINASGTREMIAFYPIFVFFVASLPLIKEAFDE